MPLSPFNCPHCHHPFQADASLASLQVVCPSCSKPVTLVSEPPIAEPTVEAPPLAERPAEEAAITDSAAHRLPPVAARSPEPLRPSANAHEKFTDDYRARQRLVEERASRRFIKNSIVWVCCAIVLALILAYFLRPGSS